MSGRLESRWTGGVMDELRGEADGLPVEPSVGEQLPPARGAFVRDRAHRFPGRRNALKVLYDDAELESVRSAALLAGLTATGFVAAAGLTLAGSGVAPATS